MWLIRSAVLKRSHLEPKAQTGQKLHSGLKLHPISVEILVANPPIKLVADLNGFGCTFGEWIDWGSIMKRI